MNFRLLIGQIFPHLYSNQKNDIINIILEVKNPYEQPYSYEDNEKRKRVVYPGVGKKQYAFLKVLPKEEIEKSFILKKKFNEFKRSFGDINENKASNVSSMSTYGVGAPLEQHAYSKMDLNSWKSSFLKFNDNYRRDRGPKGGKLQHSRTFEAQVKTNPDKFYDFILELFENNKISVDYISSGLNGLIQGEYIPEKIKIIYKKLIKLKLDKSNTLYSIWKVEYLIKHHLIDYDIIMFISHNALNHPSPDCPLNENDPDFDSINTVRGAAIHKLIQCYEHKEFSEIIFETVEKAVNDPQISVKVAIIQELAYLNYLELERSFKIFQSLIEKDDIQILKNSFRTSQYFNTKFHHQMQSYFDKIIKYEELHENGNVLVLSWINDKINNKPLYDKFVKSSDNAKLCALKIAEANLFDRDDNSIVNEKSLSIINAFLNKSGDEFSHAYSGLILRKIKPIKFKLLYDFLVKYSKSELCMDEPRYFLQLLLSSAKEHPKKCLRLLQNMNFSNRPDIQESGYYDKEPVQLILAIYSKLNMDSKNNKKYIKIALDIFDSMLKHNHLRNAANDAIELSMKS
ncbi:hypothetical protein [Kordia jejudonensis]|uniref:hypothetical protein n=1 Tax=Kordia jejudonensis TaxID=1348245 RepID=UPI0006290A81|nr:hypothetical protein [Kordia jejudonensis]